MLLQFQILVLLLERNIVKLFQVIFCCSFRLLCRKFCVFLFWYLLVDMCCRLISIFGLCLLSWLFCLDMVVIDVLLLFMFCFMCRLGVFCSLCRWYFRLLLLMLLENMLIGVLLGLIVIVLMLLGMFMFIMLVLVSERKLLLFSGMFLKVMFILFMWKLCMNRLVVEIFRFSLLVVVQLVFGICFSMVRLLLLVIIVLRFLVLMMQWLGLIIWVGVMVVLCGVVMICRVLSVVGVLSVVLCVFVVYVGVVIVVMMVRVRCVVGGVFMGRFRCRERVVQVYVQCVVVLVLVFWLVV